MWAMACCWPCGSEMEIDGGGFQAGVAQVALNGGQRARRLPVDEWHRSAVRNGG